MLRIFFIIFFLINPIKAFALIEVDITRGNLSPLPIAVSPLSIDKNKAWHIKKKLNVKLLKKGAKILEGKHNFSTFRAAACSAKSPVKKMNYVKIKRIGDKIFIRFSSKSFLQNQVRSMVGCLKYLAEGKWDLKKFDKVFKSKKRILCAPPAPSHGLFLEKVIY